MLKVASRAEDLLIDAGYRSIVCQEWVEDKSNGGLCRVVYITGGATSYPAILGEGLSHHEHW
jgi:hypothetical protein